MGRNTKIEETLNLPSMDDLLLDPTDVSDAEGEDYYDEESNQQTMNATLALAHKAEQNLALQDGDGHAEAMDVIHKETLKHARDLVDFGFNADQRSAATIFEKATMMYKVAQDSKDSKRKYQIEALKLMQSQQKIELDRMRLQHEMGNAPIETESSIVEDRNELIKRLRAQAKADMQTGPKVELE
jgi:hypothetical protein